MDDLQGVQRQLTADVRRTLGERFTGIISEHVDDLRFLGVEFDPDKLIDDVQQIVHDTFIDTSWPLCPRHGSHPLWHRDGQWWCEADAVAVARLGQLGLHPDEERV